jgi:hypothetical protein
LRSDRVSSLPSPRAIVMRARLREFLFENSLESSMLDLIMLALGLGFFAAAIGYTYACERL